MSADPLDIAADRAELERATVIARHAARAAKPRAPRACEHCEEQPVQVLPNGVHCRYCARCAGEVAE